MKPGDSRGRPDVAPQHVRQTDTLGLPSHRRQPAAWPLRHAQRL